MIKSDYHIHTTYCDGKSTVTEVVEAALSKGLEEIGFSSHCPMHDETWDHITASSIVSYHKEIEKMRMKYGDRIKIYCGMEQDYYAAVPATGFEYIIGSLHYLKCGEALVSVDHTEGHFIDGVNRFFGGDFYAFCEEYYRRVAEIVEKTNADIIGHFDLVSKFNEGGRLFDEKHPRYVEAYTSAAKRLVKTGKPFEVNTGAISRGYRKSPYPSAAQLELLRDLGASFILNSDSHSAENLCYQFEEWEEFLLSLGIRPLNSK